MLFLFGCSNENNDDVTLSELNEEPLICYATLENTTHNELKTAVVKNGASYKLSWLDDDKFKVHHDVVGDCYNASGVGKTCEAILVKKGDGFVKYSGVFREPTINHKYYAYYPVKGFKEYLGEGKMKIEIPEQVYKSSTELDNDTYPMACVTSSTKFSFKNVCGILRVSLRAKEAGLKVKSVSVTSSEINLSGDGVVTIDKFGIPTLVMDPIGADGPKPIKMVCKEAVPLSNGVAKDFLFVLPPHIYSLNTVAVKVETTDNTCSYTIPLEIPIERSKSVGFTKGLNLTLSAGGTGIEGEIAD